MTGTFLASELITRMESGTVSLEAAYAHLAAAQADLATLTIKAGRHRELGRPGEAKLAASQAAALKKQIEVAEEFLAAANPYGGGAA